MSITGSEVTAFLEKFDTVYKDALQDGGSRLIGITMEDQLAAKRKWYHKIGKSSVIQKTSRLQPVQLQSSAFEKRPLTDKVYLFNQAVDPDDIRKMIADPTSAIMRNALYAHKEQIDTSIMDKILGTQSVTVTDEDGTETTSDVSVTNSVAVDEDVYGGGTSSRGLDKSKLLQSRKLIRTAFASNPGQRLYCIGTIGQLQNLIRDDEAASSRYRNSKPYEGPGVVSDLSGFLGMDFIEYEGIPNSGSSEQVIVMAEGGLIKATSKPLTTQVLQNPNIAEFPHVIDISGGHGLCRTYEEHFVSILCDPSA